jgi:hypothetical protein
MTLDLDARSRAAEVRRRVESAFSNLDSALFSASERVNERASAISPWSPLDVAEHVTLTSHYLLMLAEKCARKSARKLIRGEAAPTKGRIGVDQLESIASHDFRWEAPEHMLPRGSVTLEEVRATLAGQCRQALSLIDMLSAGEGTLHTIRMTVLGPDARLDVYEFLLFIALHADRHAAQVRRILGTLEGRTS